MVTRRTIALAEMHRSVSAALQTANTAVNNAESVATALIAAELAGQPEQGLRCTAAYCAQTAAGKIDGYALPSIAQSAPGALIVDAGSGFAYPALDVAIDELPAIATSQGIAMAGIRRSHHCGALGCAVERLADKGLIAMMMANTPAVNAPSRGPEKLFGDNPVAFAIPLSNRPPVVADLSMSNTCPEQRPAAGDVNGLILAMMVEFFAAGLTGANYAIEASSLFEADGSPPGVGQLLVAISPRAFGGDAVLDRFTDLAVRLADDGDARLFGHHRQGARQAALREGIEVDDKLLDEITGIARPA